MHSVIKAGHLQVRLKKHMAIKAKDQGSPVFLPFPALAHEIHQHSNAAAATYGTDETYTSREL